MPYIGDIYIPALSELSVRKRRDNAIVRPFNSDPRIEELQRDADSINIRGFLVPEENKSEDDFAEDLFALIRNAAYNHLNYADKDGFVAVEGIDAPKTVEINLREFNISGRFFPRTVYERAYKFTQEVIANDFGIGFPAVIPLPVGATNVRLKSPWQTINLNTPWATLSGKDGDVPFYKPFPLFNADEATTTGVLTYLEEAYRLQTVNLDAQAEYAQWTFSAGIDVPFGTYKLKIRVRDDNVADDVKVTISGSVSGTILTETLSTGGTDFVLLETSEFIIDSYETITVKIEKAITTANVIEVDYCYIDPTYTAKLCFDVGQEYDVGEVRVYDDMNSSNETDWVRVYNKEHQFVGKIVVENRFIRLRDTGTGKISGVIYEYWDGSSYKALGGLDFTDTYPTLAGYEILEIASDKAKIRFIISSESEEVNYVDVIMRRDGIFELVSDKNNDGFIDGFSFSGRFGVWLDTNFRVKDYIELSATYNYYGHYFAFGFSPNDPLMLIITSESINTNRDNRLILRTNAQTYTRKQCNYRGLKEFKRLIGYFPNYANLFEEAEDATLSAGAYINRFIDDFSADSSAEYTLMDSNGTWTWDITNGELDWTANPYESFVKLNSLKFGTGSYEADLRITSLGTGNSNAGITFCLQDINNFYLVYLTTNNVVLEKRVGGTYYSLASASRTISVNTYYHIKIEFDSSIGSIKVYFNNEATPCIEVTDTTFSSGYVGFRGWGDNTGASVSFDNLDIQAEEVTSSGNSCVIMGGTNHGGQSGINEGVNYDFICGQDLPKGTYLAVFRLKSTSGSTLGDDFVFYVINITHDPDEFVTIDGFGYRSDEYLTSDYTYLIRLFRLDSDDEGDTIRCRVAETGTDSNPVVIFDYFLLIPISLLESQQLGPQDLAFLSMVDPNLERVLEVKS